jgi:Mn2+/Fe2+ NRAMP family transporter
VRLLAYPWVLAITLSWPLVALVVTLLRFGELPEDGEQIAAALLGFLLVGVVSGSVLISVLRRTTRRWGRMLVIAGYILAAPFGYVFGIVGPLTLEVFGGAQLPSSIDYFLLFPLTIGLYGSLPPICGALTGFLANHIRERGI